MWRISSFFSSALKGPLTLLDGLCLILSPFAIIGFVVLVIVMLDSLGVHAQLLEAIEADGVDALVTWNGVSDDGKMAVLWLDPQNDPFESVIVDTRYYSRETLAQLKIGQPVRIRYVYPPKHEAEAVLLDSYAEVKNYRGYFTNLIWPFLVMWLIVIMHPETLFLGFVDVFPSKVSGAPQA